ncbi:hypothetical protein BH11PLA2_BH11PLA2_45380 [soil metagenome]
MNRPAWLKSLRQMLTGTSPKSPIVRRPRRKPNALHFETLEDRVVPATFSDVIFKTGDIVTGTQLSLDFNLPRKTMTVTAAADGYTVALDSDTWIGINSANVTGNGTATLKVTTAGQAAYQAVNITDGGGGSTVKFANSAAEYKNSFNIALTKTDNSRGTVTFDGATTFAAANTLTVNAGRSISVHQAATLQATDGTLNLNANQTPGSLYGNFNGVEILGSVKAIGKAAIAIAGKGGGSTDPFPLVGIVITDGGSITGGAEGLVSLTGQGGSGYGLFDNGITIHKATITTLGADLQLIGIGGEGTPQQTDGVLLKAGAIVSAGGSGRVTITGTGGTISEGAAAGIRIQNTAKISTNNGNITLTGTGGGRPGSANNHGVVIAGVSDTVAGTASIAPGGTGNLAITGVAGVAGGTGVRIDSLLNSSNGTVTVKGSPAGAVGTPGIAGVGTITHTAAGTGVVKLIADAMEMVKIAAGSNSVYLRQLTAGTKITLGAADAAGVLGLTDAELDRITATNLKIGDFESGALTISAPITRTVATNVQLASSAAVTKNSTVDTKGGTFRVNQNSRVTEGTFLDVKFETYSSFGLRFMSGFGYAADKSTRDTVQVGFIPAIGKPFTPLLNLPDGVALSTTSSNSNLQNFFATLGRVSAISGTSMLDLFQGTIDGDDSQLVFVDLANLAQYADSSAGSVGFAIDRNQSFTTDLDAKRSFTPTRLFLALPDGGSRTDTARVELAGNLGFTALNGAGVHLEDVNSKKNRLIGKNNGFEFSITSGVSTVSAGLDPAGKAQPFAFTVAGLNFEADSNALTATYTPATDTFKFTGLATTQFVGGSMDVNFGLFGNGFAVTNGVLTATEANVQNILSLGGLGFTTGDLTLALDQINNKATITGKASTVFGGDAKPTFNVGFGVPLSTTDSRNGSSLVIANGTVDALSLPLDTITSSIFNVSNLGTDKTAFMTADFDATSNTFTVKGSNQQVDYRKAPLEYFPLLGGLVIGTTAALRMNVGFSSLPLATGTVTGEGLKITNGVIASLNAPVSSFSLQANTQSGTSYQRTFDFNYNPALPAADAFKVNYSTDTKLFEIFGKANLTGPTGRTVAGKDSAYTAAVSLGQRGSAGVTISETGANPSQVLVNIGDLKWAGLTFTRDSLAATFNTTTKTFDYSGSSKVTFNTLTLTAAPRTGVSGIGSALEGFLLRGTLKVDGLNLVADNLPLLFQKSGGTVEQLVPSGGAATFGITVQGRAATVTTGTDTTKSEAFILEGGTVKKTTAAVPRLVTATPITLAGIQLDNATGRIDFPNTATNATAGFVAALGTAKFVIGDVNSKAIVDLPLTLVDSGLNVGNKAKFTFEAVTIQDIDFATGALTASYSIADHRYTFAGKGVYLGVQDVTIGGSPSNPQIIEERGVFKLIGFTPPAIDFPVAGVIFPTKGLPSTKSTVGTKTYLTYTGVKVVKVGGASMSLTLGGGGTKGLVYNITDSKFAEIGATLTGTFTLGGVAISASGTLQYVAGATAATDELNIKGAATFKFKASGNPITVTIYLGDGNTPGLVIRDGQVKSAQASISADFKLYGLDIAVNNLGVSYQADQQVFAVFGGIKISSPAKGGKRVLDKFAVTLGTADAPGLVIKNGDLDRIDVALSGALNFYGINATANNLRLAYTRANDTLALTGGVKITLANKFNATVAFPGRGLLINTSTGEVELKGLKIKVADANFGALAIRHLEFTYDVSDAGVTTITGAGELSLPLGLTVAAKVKIVDDRLSAISFKLERTPGIPVGSPPVLYLSSISGEVNNLDDLDHFQIKATVTGTVGPSIKIFGQTRALVKISGSIDISTERIILSGNVQLLEGVLGSGNGAITIFFTGNEVLRITANVNLYPGNVIRGSIYFSVDRDFNVTLSARLGVYVPNGIKKIGGKNLGSLGIYIQIRPNQAREQSFARFNATVLKILDVQATVDFAGKIYGYVDPPIFKKIKFNFNLPGAREYVIPLGADDEPVTVNIARPAMTIDSISAVPGTPRGSIAYTVTTQAPTATTIDLYADSDTDGYDGRLIASGLPYQPGQQSFSWADLATYAPVPYNPDHPLYVYGVVNDGQNMPVYSAYSSGVTPPDYDPSLAVPVAQGFNAGGTLVFSAARGNAITIADPLAKPQPDALIDVTLKVNDGTLTLANVSEVVTVEGDHSDTLRLTGKAMDINAILEGLRYTPLENTFFDDSLSVSINRFPENTSERLERTVNLIAHPLSLTFDESESAPVQNYVCESGPVTLLDHVMIHDLASGHIDGATIRIQGFQPGHDILDLAIDDQLDLGVKASFDAVTGVLMITGVRSVEEYQHVLHMVTFNSNGTGLRNLIVDLGDDVNDTAELIEPVTLVACTPPSTDNLPSTVGGATLDLQQTTVLAEADETAVLVAPNAVLTHANPSAIIAGVDVAITANFQAGVDYLRVMGLPDGVTAQFDPLTGVLQIRGAAPVLDYQYILRSVSYANHATVRDGSVRTLAFRVSDGTDTSAIQTLTVNAPAVPVVETGFGSLVYTHGQASLTIDSHLTIEYLGGPTLTGAQVWLKGDNTLGDDRLLFTPQNGITGTYDSATGLLTLTGSASVANYQTALRSVQYRNLRVNPTPGFREVAFSIFDGTAVSAEADFLIDVDPESVAPLVTVGSTTAMYLEGFAPAALVPGITFADQDGDSGRVLEGALVKITGYVPGEDVLHFTPVGGITGDFDTHQGILFLDGRGTLADYQSVLRSVTYENLSEAPTTTSRTLSITLEDGATDDAVGSLSLTVQSRNNPPTRTAGTVKGVTLLENAFATSLGFSSVAYAPPSSLEPTLVYTITAVPDATLGQIQLAHGTVAAVGSTVTLAQLQGARFTPALNAQGTGQFSYRVAALNPILNAEDSATLTESQTITVAGVATTTANSTFLSQVYRDVLGRNPDAPGLAYWTNKLTTGMSRSAVVASIQNSTESKQRQIAGLYQTLLGRSPSTAESNVKLQLFNSGGTFESVRATIAGSSEFYNGPGTGSNDGFVQALYQKFLNRAADTSGFAYWTGKLRGGASLTSVATAIALSTEATLLESKSLYQTLLRRDPTIADPIGLVYHANLLKNGQRHAAVNHFIASGEYFIRYSTADGGQSREQPSDADLIQQWLNSDTDPGNAVITQDFDSVGILGDSRGGHGGGTLIGSNDVITAAHLVDGRAVEDLRFTIGGSAYRVSEVFVHPDYNAAALGTDAANDIAILHLSRDVVNVTPSELFEGTPKVGETVTLVGYGPRPGDPKDAAPVSIRHAGTTPIDGMTPKLITWNYDNAAESDTVAGDSGGAEFIWHDGRYDLAGVTSGGTLDDAQFGDHAYNTRVDAYGHWIVHYL